MAFRRARRLHKSARLDNDPRPVAAFCEEGIPPLPMSRASSARAAGEQAMLRAMLLDAIQCLEGQGCPKRDRGRLATEARAWVAQSHVGSGFSFENVCAYLGLPADQLRRNLLRVAASRGQQDDASDLGRRASGVEIRARAERNQRIRSLRAMGLRPRELAERFGLSYESILAICTPRVSARHVAA